MSWPSPQDYSEAVQSPLSSFVDEELRGGMPVLNQLGLPKPVTGNFATVFQFKCGTRNWAVRCFLREVKDQQLRYEAIGEQLRRTAIPSMVHFDYLKTGIRVRGRWYPIVKMEWVDGEPLDVYIARRLTTATAIKPLTKKWIDVLGGLRQAEIAHGDLQHGNILVSGGEIKLIDYDGMFVPRLMGRKSNEEGHRNYQHPRRTARDFGPHLDNFPGWIVLLSLLALGKDPALWWRLSGGDDCLLFRERDFRDAHRSPVFSLIALMQNKQITEMAEDVRRFLDVPMIDVPPAPAGVSFRAIRPEWLYPHSGETVSEATTRSSACQTPVVPTIVLDGSLLHEQPVRIRGVYRAPCFMEQGGRKIEVRFEKKLTEPQQRRILLNGEQGHQLLLEGILLWDKRFPMNSKLLAERVEFQSRETAKDAAWPSRSSVPELIVDASVMNGEYVRMCGVYAGLYRKGNSFILRQGKNAVWVVYSELLTRQRRRILAAPCAKGFAVTVEGQILCDGFDSAPEIIAVDFAFEDQSGSKAPDDPGDDGREIYPWRDVNASRRNRELQASQANDRREIEALLQATRCPSCGRSGDDLAIFWFASPPSTWEWLCGSAGWMIVCDTCRRQVHFELSFMN